MDFDDVLVLSGSGWGLNNNTLGSDNHESKLRPDQHIVHLLQAMESRQCKLFSFAEKCNLYVLRFTESRRVFIGTLTSIPKA